MFKTALAAALLFATPASAIVDCISPAFDKVIFQDAYRECPLEKNRTVILGAIKAEMTCYGEENTVSKGVLFILPAANPGQYWLIEDDEYLLPRIAEVCPE